MRRYWEAREEQILVNCRVPKNVGVERAIRVGYTDHAMNNVDQSEFNFNAVVGRGKQVGVK